MVGDVYGPSDAVGSVLRREATRWWWLPLGAGIAWLIIGWAVLRANVTSLTTVGVLIGFVFLGVALTETVLAWMFHGGWRVMHAVLAGVFLLGALWSFARPIDTFFALTSVLGLLLLLQGMGYIAKGIRVAARLVVLGVLALHGNPDHRARPVGLDLRRGVDARGTVGVHPAVGRLHGDLPWRPGRGDRVHDAALQQAA